MNIKLTIAYDGTNYHGFQEQRGSGLATIQEELQKALSHLGKENIQVIGAGRTDSGVHARGQVVNFHSDSWPVPLKKIPLAVNTYLPPDVVVLQAEEVEPDFHARFSALGKTYRYNIYNHPITDPFCIRYTLHEPRPLDENAMDKAAAYLVGEFDFKCFQAVGTPVKSTVRRINQAAVTRTDRRVCVEVSANGFLYNMVRIITGTLINVGLKKIKPEAIPEIIATGNRKYAGKTVPPEGLSMEKVYYP